MMGQWIRRAVLLAGVTAVALVPADATSHADPKPPNMSYLDNGLIKVGVDLDRGGSIGYLTDSKNGGNVVNVHDLGRWIGQSYYAGPKPFGEPYRAWKDWPWNPVSAGDVYGNPSQVVETKNDGRTLYVKSVPRQWALKDVPGDCTFETWITLESRTVQVRNRLTNQRNDQKQYPAMDQELPAVYTIGKLHRLLAYTGERPFTEDSIKEISKAPSEKGRPRWSTFFATEHWAALVNKDDWGLGIIHPGVVRFLGGFHGKTHAGGPEDDPTGYAAPVRQEVLDHNIVYEYRYTLVLDTLANIRKVAYQHGPQSGLPDYRFTSDRQHWWFVNAEDAGLPVKGHLRVNVERDDPQMFGPEGFWDAKDAPKIFVRAAHHTRNRMAEVFWETTEKPGFSPERKVRFTVKPDGTFHTYEVDLAGSPAYRGKIRRLRFDPVETGTTGEFVDVAFISVKKE